MVCFKEALQNVSLVTQSLVVFVICHTRKCNMKAVCSDMLAGFLLYLPIDSYISFVFLLFKRPTYGTNLIVQPMGLNTQD